MIRSGWQHIPFLSISPESAAISLMPEFASNLRGLPEHRYKPGEPIITEGEAAAGLFFLESGTVRVSRDGMEIHKVSIPGAIFGEMSYLLDSKATATVTAETPVTMKLVQDREEFLREHPETALYTARILAARLHSVVQYLVDLKSQYGGRDDHFGMMDDILDSIINKHPRKIDKELTERDQVDD